MKSSGHYGRMFVMKSKHIFIGIFLLLFLCILALFYVPDMIIANKLGAIETVVIEEISKGSFPGAVICAGRKGKLYYLKAYGNEVIEPFKEAANENTIFDMASVTKPVSTATSVMILIDRGKIKLDDKVAAYLPEFSVGGKEEVQIKHLLTHTSGLPAYTNANTLKKEFGNPCPENVIEKICSFDARCKPGEEFKYSCLGFITLAKIVEVVSGEPVDVFARANIFEPLGMQHTTFNPPEALEPRIAATQIVEDKLLRGTVHDPLAQLMDGVSGNAGLFSTGYDLSIYCRMLLNEGVYEGKRILSPEAVAFLTEVQMHGRCYGFDASSSYSWIKGQFASEDAFCHSGYTGTSIVCDPSNDVFLIILTNRAHPHDKGASKPVRKKVADIVFSALGGA